MTEYCVIATLHNGDTARAYVLATTAPKAIAKIRRLSIPARRYIAVRTGR